MFNKSKKEIIILAEKDDKKIFEKGIKLLEEKKYKKSIDQFIKITDEFPYSNYTKLLTNL